MAASSTLSPVAPQPLVSSCPCMLFQKAWFVTVSTHVLSHATSLTAMTGITHNVCRIGACRLAHKVLRCKQVRRWEKLAQ